MKKPRNEPILEYRKGSTEREALEKALADYSKGPVDVPLRIGNEKITHGLEKKQLIVRWLSQETWE